MDQSGSIEYTYLKAVLDWLDVNLEHLVSRWQLAGQAPEDRFRGLHISDSEALSITRSGASSHWGSSVLLPAEKEAEFELARAAALEAVQSAQAGSEDAPRLLSLAQSFGLSEFEWWAFIICLAPALDLRYERIYGYLQDDVTATHARVDLILMLLLPETLQRLDYMHYFEESSALRRFRLILPVEEAAQKAPNGLRQAFMVAPAVLSWLLGHYSPESLAVGAELILPDENIDQEEALSVFDLEKMPSVKVMQHLKPILSLYGEDGLQQALMARRVATGLQQPLVTVIFEKDLPVDHALERLIIAVRDARMLRALLFVRRMDVLVDREGRLLTSAFETLSHLDSCVITGTAQPFRFSDMAPDKSTALMQLKVDDLTAIERMGVWKVMLDEVDEAVGESDLKVLSGQFTLTSGEVVAASNLAMSAAIQEGRPLEAPDLFAAARFHSGHILGELAQKIEPRYVWNDLVLPETPMTMLKELVSMVKSRTQVLEEWGLGKKLTASAGISALFTGPSGTGKTLAAQIIAHELGIDLYRIDLSTIVSKYIGETEKNLEHIFTEAQTSNAILFFDEADAIFGKRSEVKDAHDRYANIEVGYLLQRMEAYDGLAILATNLRANLDEAFTRRLQFIINFPFPDDVYRLRIWQVLMPAGIPKSDLDLSIMAKRFKLSGGNIRNIIVSAAYLAANDRGVLTMAHLMHGARREFQKMGRLINESDFVQQQG
jgi:hypothetical protein